MTEVILRESVTNLGHPGDIVTVSPGYARNYLVPRGIAYFATEGNKKRIAAESKARSSRVEAGRADAQAFANKLAEVTLTVAGKAGEEGKLFGSITAHDIADGLAKQGLEVDRRRIELGQPIKALGFHTVGVRLHPDVHAEVRVQVVGE